ncbi:fungal-specific transcription factor domain-containing protein, partial [Amylostereum chailletii]
MSAHAYRYLHDNPYPLVKRESPVSSIASLSFSSSHHSRTPPIEFSAHNDPTTPFTFSLPMSQHPWDNSPASPYPTPATANHPHFSLPSIADDYDDDPDLNDFASSGPSTSSKAYERVIRRRSSKACDQCRKSKCKCERASESDPCKACIMLGTSCTFLGPSRKRGPPKGYIDAIEARLHQTEALVGILLAADDVRAKGILDDLSDDPLAREIIERVDNSAYGVKGRSRGVEPPGGSNKAEPKTKEHGSASPSGGGSSSHPAHPSRDWQDRLSNRLSDLAHARGQNIPGRPPASERTSRPVLSLSIAHDAEDAPEHKRQRRRLERSPHGQRTPPRSTSPSSRSSRSREHPTEAEWREANGASGAGESSGDDDALTGEVGQLSINEERELRYHGKASGLHLLGVKDRVDGRNEGGIWRFPKARVWPPLPNSQVPLDEDMELPVTLPDNETQKQLLDLYFTYVHPALPVVMKQAFMDDFRTGHVGTPPPESEPSSPSSSSPLGRRRSFISPLLLLVVFSLAARYTPPRGGSSPPPTEGAMWPAGDAYFNCAKMLLNRTYAAPRPSTCQALLLMGYREIGIGAMAQAWIYVGMAVRMAQDLGIHKSADRWMHVGSLLFSRAELQERRRIWSACVIMDKYVSSYIGRPVCIYERDFDTELPSVDEVEEREEWQSTPSSQQFVYDPDEKDPPRPLVAVPGRILSCFNASATLSVIHSRIIQSIYAVRASARLPEATRLEESLNKWYLDLPEHLRFDPATAKGGAIPPPHVLTLHTAYWCIVLLLHRPFMGSGLDARPRSANANGREEPDATSSAQKNYDLCVQAANRITSIVAAYQDHYCIRRAPVFLSYYLFTAGIMHVNTLNVYPDDPQARKGLTTCLDVLKLMETVWPSAGRAWELLHGSKVNLASAGAGPASGLPPRAHHAHHAHHHHHHHSNSHGNSNNKRSAEHFLAEASHGGAP